MTGPFKSDPVNAVQRQLFPGNVFDLLPTEHDKAHGTGRLKSDLPAAQSDC